MEFRNLVIRFHEAIQLTLQAQRWRCLGRSGLPLEFVFFQTPSEDEDRRQLRGTKNIVEIQGRAWLVHVS